MQGVLAAWGRILLGDTPSLSIEITRECPLRCPGCYAYGDDHLGGGTTLRQLPDLKGHALVEGILGLVRQYRPVHVSLVGGEPLVRYRELNQVLPRLAAMGVHTQVVTSAVRPIPLEWLSVPRLTVAVSVDGLPPEHDERRRPATYDRILAHIAGHQISVHCTVTRQQVRREGYLEEFVRFWSARRETKRIWISLYTPQVGEISAERLTAADRRRVVADLHTLRAAYPKLDMSRSAIDVYAEPPRSPAECIFSQVTRCVSADLETRITPCQFGGRPDCANCGCLASAGLAAVGRHRLPLGLPVESVFSASRRIGLAMRRIRRTRPTTIVGRPPRMPSSDAG